MKKIFIISTIIVVICAGGAIWEIYTNKQAAKSEEAHRIQIIKNHNQATVNSMRNF